MKQRPMSSRLPILIAAVGVLLAVFAPMGERRPYYVGILVLAGLDPVLESRVGAEHYPRLQGRSFTFELMWIICLTGTIGNWLPPDPRAATLLVLNIMGLTYYVGVCAALAGVKKRPKSGRVDP